MAAAARAEPIVVCREATKEFRQGDVSVRALRGVDLEVLPGELTLVAGPSGCGKTTLISVIAGMLRTTSGSIRVLGVELSKMTAAEQTAFRGQHIGFVFQQFNLLPFLTAAENAAVPLIVLGRPPRSAIVRARELLSEMSMAERSEALPIELSGGEQQRVAIARALIHEPRLIVCDEPTSALDARTGQAIMELLRRVSVQPGRAVVVVTHDPRVFPYGDRMATMDDGRVVGVARREEALPPTSLQDLTP